MKKVFAALAVLSIISATAYGKVGVGYVDFDKAVSVKYWMEQYGFQGTVRAEFDAAKEGEAESSTLIDLSAYFLYPLVKTDKVWLNCVLGGSYVMWNNIDQRNPYNLGYNTNVDRTAIGLRLALSPEVHITDNVSLECMFGLAFAMYGTTKVNDVEVSPEDKFNAGTTFGYPLSFSGGIGFHFYLPEVVSTSSGTPTETPPTEIEEDIEE